MYDLVIIGGGPAGVAAGIYAARKRLKTHLVTYEFGGQSTVSTGIQNWIGTVEIPGLELAENLKKHLFAYKEDIVDVTEGDKVNGIEKKDGHFIVKTENGKSIETKTVLMTAGSHRRQLGVPGADKFEHKGVTYCASCDGPMFGGADVVVIGGGNAAFESAAQLLAYCKSVTLLQRGAEYRADPSTVAAVLAHPNMKGITNTEIVSVEGDQFVSGLTYKDSLTGEIHQLPCTGVFVEIGALPSTKFLEGVVELNKTGHVVTDPKSQRTSTPGIWAAGDCTDGLYHQNNIAVGDAVKALEDIYIAVKTA
jgi:alkyl hydroperoxide reductase subunit F